ncbi:ComF family protein [Alicyclobacillus tolerans]|uniref:ComF family protein n=1 Tax=Alicyclobacillus tolerans TaxID=90970 RepID=UPI003B7B1A22
MRTFRGYTLSFLLASFASFVLDMIYFNEQHRCVLCGRTLYREHQKEDNLILLDKVCLFCQLKLLQVDILPARRSLVVQGRQVPVFAAFPYHGFLPEVIRSWKYDGALGLTDWLVSPLLPFIEKQLPCSFDMIVPVPTTNQRITARGYQQTEVLAYALSKKIRRPVVSLLSKQSIQAESQTGKNKAERMDAIQHAIQVVFPERLQKRRLLLVDDVVTTGATMAACAKELLNVGAQSVMGVAIAYVP